MKTNFNVQLTDFETIRELPHAWTNEQYTGLLDALDYGDTTQIPAAELRDMCMLAIADAEPHEAAIAALTYMFREHLNDGQIVNLAHEMLEEKMWEEYAEIWMHQSFYNIGTLLYASYNGKFPLPEAVRFNLLVTGISDADLAIFEENTAIPLLRLLASGMPENTLLNRLFTAQLAGEPFPEAEHILWQLKKLDASENSRSFEVISSLYWFHDLKFTEQFDGITCVNEPNEEV
jgi:hypothetical protein